MSATRISLFALILLVLFIGLVTVIVVLIFWGRNSRNKPMTEEAVVVQKTLGETLKAHRTGCNMTQEYVAEAVGVSRQAVSKWEVGSSEPSTSNLLALAKLFDVSVEELIKDVSLH